jgi:hypothetical protein
MQLLPGEQKLSESSDGTVVLTNYRVRLEEGRRGRYRLVSIMLDQVASCSIETRSYPVLVLLGAVFALATFQMSGERFEKLRIGVGAVVFVLCVLVYGSAVRTLS